MLAVDAAKSANLPVLDKALGETMEAPALANLLTGSSVIKTLILMLLWRGWSKCL